MKLLPDTFQKPFRQRQAFVACARNVSERCKLKLSVRARPSAESLLKIIPSSTHPFFGRDPTSLQDANVNAFQYSAG